MAFVPHSLTNLFMSAGKKYQAALEKLGDTTELRNLETTLTDILSLSTSSFDETMEIHIKTKCNPKHADQIVRSTVILPNGTGKTVKVAVFSDDEAKIEEAKKAGADITGGDDLVAEVIKGNIDFDVALATPTFMKSLAKAARILGPKGLMPSPKAGTVTLNIGQAVEELKKGKIEFRTDKQGIIHSIFGKKSFSKKDLLENVTTLLSSIKEARPSGVKGAYITKVTITSTMSPGVNIDFSGLV